jgi:hypothetical protein
MLKHHKTVTQSISKKAGAIILTTIATLSALITIYIFLFQRNRVEVTFQLISDVNALDINQEVPNLQILYGSEDILSSKRNLRIIDIRVINSGSVDILKTFFDERAPFGIAINEAEILQKPSLLDSSNTYIETNLQLQLVDKNTVFIEPIIFEKGEYFSLRFIVLHSVNIRPIVKSVGKIAGLLEVPLVEKESAKPGTPFFKLALGGNILVQLVRALIYFASIVIAIILIALLASWISERLRKARRAKGIREYKNRADYSIRKTDNVIFQRYIDDGMPYLKAAHSLLKSASILNSAYKKQRRFSASINDFADVSIEMFERGMIRPHQSDSLIIKQLLNDGLVVKEGKELRIVSSMKTTLDSLYNYLSRIATSRVRTSKKK